MFMISDDISFLHSPATIVSVFFVAASIIITDVVVVIVIGIAVAVAVGVRHRKVKFGVAY